MAKGLLMVLTKPSAAEREDEYNEWYDEVHLDEVKAVPGVVSAARHRIAESSAARLDAGSPLAARYLAVYELDAPDLKGVVREINARAADGRFQMSAAMDPDATVVLYEQI